MKTIEYSREGNVGIVKLIRPEKMNVIGSDLLGEMDEILGQIEKDVSLGAVIITGMGKVFAAGADIKEVKTIEGINAAHAFVKQVQTCLNRIESLEKPVIAAVNGLALGGGCELALVCDIRIASEKATFGLPEINLGVLPGAGGTQRLPRTIGIGLAKELLFLGESVVAREAFRMGLVNRVVEPDLLMKTALAVAGRLAGQPQVALRLIKSAVNQGLQMNLSAALEYESRCFEMLFTTQDQKEGMQAFVEKRKAHFKGF